MGMARLNNQVAMTFINSIRLSANMGLVIEKLVDKIGSSCLYYRASTLVSLTMLDVKKERTIITIVGENYISRRRKKLQLLKILIYVKI